MPHKHTAFEICGWYYGRRSEWKPARELTIYTGTQADDRNLSLNSSGSLNENTSFYTSSILVWAGI